MSPEQKLLVQNSFAKAAPYADEIAALFYGRLFVLDPAVKSLFHNDMLEQRRKLMQTISIAVKSLDRLETLIPTLQELGRRHVGYGVKDKNYDTVGEALLWSLGQFLGADFTSEVKEAWATLYGILADTMKGTVAAAA
ncbi:MAG: globin family protein [Candidatus Binatia bacterium]